MNSHARKVIAQRRTETKLLRRYGATDMADAVDRYSDDLERALRADARDAHVGPEYEIREAAARSQYSIAQLSKMVQSGELEDRNPDGVARVRALDLPCRPGRIPVVLGWMDDRFAPDEGEGVGADQEDDHTTGGGEQSPEVADPAVDTEAQKDSASDDDPDSPFTQEEYEAFRHGRRSAHPTRSRERSKWSSDRR